MFRLARQGVYRAGMGIDALHERGSGFVRHERPRPRRRNASACVVFRASEVSAAELPAPAPRYAANDLERAFGFMDGDRDGKVSRQEASGFRGVAKNFDRADTNQDGFLSREEFDTAMNYVKPK